MLFAAFGILCLVIACRKGFLKSWREYYPTILFVIIGNESCELLMCRKPLWEYTDIFGQYYIADILLMFILYTGTVILFLSYLPHSFKGTLIYVAFWVSLYAVIEVFSLLLGIFIHSNGWNMYFTLAHNLVMFVLIILHKKKPMPAWIISFFFSIGTVLLFKIPFAR